MNSMSSGAKDDGKYYLGSMEFYINQEAPQKWHKLDVPVSEWKRIYGSRDTPQQPNCDDCGVMASKAADAIEASLLLKFGRNWPGIRLRRRMPHVLGASDGRLEAPLRCPRCTS